MKVLFIGIIITLTTALIVSLNAIKQYNEPESLPVKETQIVIMMDSITVKELTKYGHSTVILEIKGYD